jgi:hypothetical protein
MVLPPRREELIAASVRVRRAVPFRGVLSHDAEPQERGGRQRPRRAEL